MTNNMATCAHSFIAGSCIDCATPADREAAVTRMRARLDRLIADSKRKEAGIVCVQCDQPSCYWCERPDDDHIKRRALAIEAKIHPHKHRCAVCSLKNIQKGLATGASDEEDRHKSDKNNFG